MITEEEAFWSGIAVATMMLGGGFSMLFLRTFTGYGAVVLALGLMTMALTIQLRARPVEAELLTPYKANMIAPAARTELSTETTQTQSSTEQPQTEVKAEQPESHPQEESKSTEPSAAEPAKPVEQPTPSEPPQAPPQPQQEPQPQPPPQAPVEQNIQPPKPEEKPQEQPQPQVATPPAN